MLIKEVLQLRLIVWINRSKQFSTFTLDELPSKKNVSRVMVTVVTVLLQLKEGIVIEVKRKF